MAKKKKSNKLLYILLGVAVLLIAVTHVGKQQGWIGGQAELEVNFADAVRTRIVEKVSGTGTIQPETEVKLSPDVPGEIIDLFVEEGQEVEAGKLLMRIRPDNFELALDRAEASLNQQRANLEDSRSGLSRSEAQFAQAQQSFERNKKFRI
jgi:HlyD family secretion protein